MGIKNKTTNRRWKKINYESLFYHYTDKKKMLFNLYHLSALCLVKKVTDKKQILQIHLLTTEESLHISKLSLRTT